jgi:hypothetical protein
MKFYITNKSTVVSDTDYNLILEGLGIYLNTLCEDWSMSQVFVINSVQPLTSTLPNTIIIFDSIDDDISNSYDFDNDPNSVARVFAKTILESGGSVLYQDGAPFTVSQQLCNEIIGLISNTDMNKWYMDQNKVLWWGDICSPVYGNIYTIDLPNDTQIGFSDYILPAYFGPTSLVGPYNKMDTLMGPFGLDEQGYSIKFENDDFSTTFGPSCPQEKMEQINIYLDEIKSRFIDL